MSIKNLHHFLCSVIALFILQHSTGQSTNSFTNQETKIDAYVKHLQKRHEIPGVALAILQKGKVIYQKNFGYASLEHESPIIPASVFRVYSLTKPIVSVAVFQLIEQGKLSLEDQISDHLMDIPDGWKNIQIKHLLTHSSGLPDMAPFTRMADMSENEARDTVFKQPTKSSLGAVYQYNQTNFWLLQKIIEKVSKEKLEDFILKNQFEGETQNVFFSSNSKTIVKHRVTPYFPFETGTIQIDHSTIKGRYMFAANGLNITLNEFVKWDQRLRKNQLLSLDSKKKMWQIFEYSNSQKRFAYGWDKRILNEHNSYGFSGSLITAYRVFPEDDISIVFLSNGLGSYYNIENIINHIVSLVNPEIQDAQNTAFEWFSKTIVEDGAEALYPSFLELQQHESASRMNFESALNDVGYQLINQKRMVKALAIFQFNTQKFPQSANVFDSLGEIYIMMNEFDLAEVNYKKAIALGGTNGNAKNMLERIEQIKKN
jgi:CubicO group peptidase (beta-lactamase class C family)